MTIYKKKPYRLAITSKKFSPRQKLPNDVKNQSGQWFMRKAIEASNRGATFEARRYFKLANDIALGCKR